jgi:nickel superoxide dismutase
MLNEHIVTIDKSIAQINELSADAGKNSNQLIRWVNNKEATADDFAQIIMYYFLQQRVKPIDDESSADYAKYITQVTLCHKLLIASMKAKQAADPETAKALKTLLDQFEASYMNKEMATHLDVEHSGHAHEG